MRIGLMGCGNMGGAIMKSIALSKEFSKKDLFAFDVNSDKLKTFSSGLGIHACSSAVDLVQKSEVVILACKPKDMPSLCAEISSLVSSNHLVISIAAGISLKFYEKEFKLARVIRVMPNLPLLVNEGMSTFVLGKKAIQADRKLVEQIFGLKGKTLEVSDDLMDISTIAFASMPGWCAYLMDIFIQASKKHGFTEQQAELVIAQAFRELENIFWKRRSSLLN